MSLSVRFVAVLITLIGVAAPLVAAVASGVIAKMSPNLSHGKIIRFVKLCTMLNIVCIGSSLTLMMLIPLPLARWAIATVIALVIGVIASGLNLSNAMDRFKASVRSEDAATPKIGDAHSVANG